MRALLAAVVLSAFAVLPHWSRAAVIYTPLAAPLTTAANGGGGCCDGTGVWFNPLTGYAESRGYYFPDTLNADGLYFLLLDAANYNPWQALIYTQGLFSRGNGVVYASSSNLNPAWLGAGAVIGPATGYQNPGAGFPDIGPAYGNGRPGRGFIGLTIRDPLGASSSDILYGYADVTLRADYGMTLNGFAFETVRNAAIVATPVPEVGSGALLALGLAGLAAACTRRRVSGN